MQIKENPKWDVITLGSHILLCEVEGNGVQGKHLIGDYTSQMNLKKSKLKQEQILHQRAVAENSKVGTRLTKCRYTFNAWIASFLGRSIAYHRLVASDSKSGVGSNVQTEI